jgi:hypothetical protein
LQANCAISSKDLMLYACTAKLNVTENVKTFAKIFGN